MAIVRAGKTDITRLVTLIKNRFGNVENKSSLTIRSELTKGETVKALGFTPLANNTIISGVDIIE